VDVVTNADVSLRAAIDGEELDLRVAGSGNVTIAGGPTVEPIVLHVEAVGHGSPLTLRLSSPEEAPAGDGPPAATVGAPPLRARVAIAGEVAWVFIEGDLFRVEVAGPQQETARRRDRSSDDGLAAPMPATVIRILVEAGQTVARGDTLVLLEAMKMEMPIKAPRDGRVAAIRCQPGELVQPGSPLIELEDDSHAG